MTDPLLSPRNAEPVYWAASGLPSSSVAGLTLSPTTCTVTVVAVVAGAKVAMPDAVW